MRKMFVEPGMRVVMTEGDSVTVATIICGRVYAYTINGWLKAVVPCHEAWGGEHNNSLVNAA